MITKVFDVALKIGREDIVTAHAIVVQNDYDVYGLNIKIFDGNAEIDYSQVASATITFALANKAVVQSDPERLTLSAYGISYEMGTSEISCPGTVIASVQLLGADGERLTTARFKFSVQSDLITPGAVQGDSKFPLLQQLLADVEQLKQDIVNLQVSDNSLMDAKLSNAAGQIKARVATHLADSVTDSDGAHGLKIETGTFTPVLAGGTVAGSNTYSYQAGVYRVIGSRVFADIAIKLSAKDSAMSGAISITGLPFLSKHVAALRYSATIGQVGLISMGTAKGIVANIASATAKIDLYKIDVSAVQAADIDGNMSITLHVNYEKA